LRQFKVTERITPRNGNRAASVYATDINRSIVMSPEEEVEVAKLAAGGDKDAQDKLVLANLRFVISVAKSYTANADTVEELIQVGNIGLMEASTKFDPSLGFKFISFAVWHIRKEMIQHLAKYSRMVRMPLNKSQLLSHIKASQSSLEGRLGRPGTELEILDDLHSKGIKLAQGLDVETLEVIIKADLKHSSLDAELGHDPDALTLLDKLAGDDNIANSDLNTEDNRTHLAELFECLNQREEHVVREIYGIGKTPNHPRTINDLADEFECSNESIRLILRKSTRKLKIRAKSLNLNPSDIFG